MRVPLYQALRAVPATEDSVHTIMRDVRILVRCTARVMVSAGHEKARRSTPGATQLCGWKVETEKSAFVGY